MGNFLKLVIAIGVSELAGMIGAFFTTPAISGWYAGLVKPALNPPAWVFGPAWTILYALMGISLFLVWKQHSNILQNVGMLRVWKIGIVVFFVQLFLNALWSIIFFGSTSLTINGLNNIGIALIEIAFLWLAILATIIAFSKVSRPAAWLLLPYILWVSFAGYLNYSIWTLNLQSNIGETTLSGVQGVVLLGPICPVVKYPPEGGCADKPYAATLVVTTADGARVVKEFESGADGTFRVALPPGEYAIRSASAAKVLPHCASNGIINVEANATTEAEVFCDSGIR